MKDFFRNKKLLEQVQFVAATAIVVGLSMHNKMNLPQVLLRVGAFALLDIIANRLLMSKYYSPYNVIVDDLDLNDLNDFNIPTVNTHACREFLEGGMGYQKFQGKKNLDNGLKDNLLALHERKMFKDLVMLFVAIPFAFSSLQNTSMTLLQSTLFLGSVAFIKDFISCNLKSSEEPVLFHNNLPESVMQLALFKGMINGYEKYAQTFISSTCHVKVAKCVEFMAGLFAACISFGVKECVSSKFQKNQNTERDRLIQEDRNSERF